MEPEAKAPSGQRKVVVLLAVVIVLLLAVILFVLQGRDGGSAEDIEDSTPKLGYAEGVTVVEDPNALQKAVDEMYENAQDPGVGLEYKGEAQSADGENFSCYIANSASNRYDMYIQIFADAALTDQLYLSQLLRPGTAFDNITLDHSLEAGRHTTYVVFTQVEEDLESIHAQVVVTIDFVVVE